MWQLAPVRIWNAIENHRYRPALRADHREPKEKPEIATEEARAPLADRRLMLDSADVIATFAEVALNGRVRVSASWWAKAY